MILPHLKDNYILSIVELSSSYISCCSMVEDLGWKGSIIPLLAVTSVSYSPLSCLDSSREQYNFFGQSVMQVGVGRRVRVCVCVHVGVRGAWNCL